MRTLLCMHTWSSKSQDYLHIYVTIGPGPAQCVQPWSLLGHAPCKLVKCLFAAKMSASFWSLNHFHFAGNGSPVSKKQCGLRRRSFVADMPHAIQTDAEQRLFWVLRDKYKTLTGSPNYREMAAGFNVAVVQQIQLVKRQVSLPVSFCIFRVAHARVAHAQEPLQLPAIALHEHQR